MLITSEQCDEKTLLLLFGKNKEVDQLTCTDPGIFDRGVGGSMPNGQKTAWTFYLFYFSPQLILQFAEGVQWFYYMKNYSSIFRGGGGGVQLFPGGVQMLISIVTHITCGFPGGVRKPYIPLWIRTWLIHQQVYIYLLHPIFKILVCAADQS